MAGKLDNELVERYARGPAPATIEAAKSLHENIRLLLGDAEYATLLQGSYKNDTALHDMNDVDIVVVSRSTMSGAYGRPVPWADLFGRIERRLQSDARYAGKYVRNDKCIRVNTQVRIDIVPAAHVGDPTADPIVIYSHSTGVERRNWPRAHHVGATAKSRVTDGAFKRTVRLYKRWARCWFGRDKIAPSYYLECAIHGAPTSLFSGDLARDFVSIGQHLASLRYSGQVLPRIAGEGDLFTAAEWPADRFSRFQETLARSVTYASRAITSSNADEARALWVNAFNGQRAA